MAKLRTRTGKFKKYTMREHLVIDEFLDHMMTAARTGMVNLQGIKKEVRPDWLTANLRYLKSIYRGFKWARGLNRRTIDGIIRTAAPRSKSTNKLLSGRGSERSIECS